MSIYVTVANTLMATSLLELVSLKLEIYLYCTSVDGA